VEAPRFSTVVGLAQYAGGRLALAPDFETVVSPPAGGAARR
jgi:hypothetical protein